MLGRMQSNTPPLQKLASSRQYLDSVINHETFHSPLSWKKRVPDVMETGPFKPRYELRHRTPKYKTSYGSMAARQIPHLWFTVLPLQISLALE